MSITQDYSASVLTAPTINVKKKSNGNITFLNLRNVYGVHGGGSRGNQRKQRPLAQKGAIGWQQCCNGSIDGLPCCSTCPAPLYQGVPPPTARIAGSTRGRSILR